LLKKKKTKGNKREDFLCPRYLVNLNAKVTKLSKTICRFTGTSTKIPMISDVCFVKYPKTYKGL
jgi:hypothetical protein